MKNWLKLIFLLLALPSSITAMELDYSNPRIWIKVDRFLKAAAEGKCDILKEYVLDPFFKQYINFKHPVNKKTPLINAVYNEHLEIVKFLIQNGGDINLEGPNHSNGKPMSPLFVAAREGNLDIVKLLLNNGAKDIDMAIERARDAGEYDIANFIAKYKAKRKKEIKDATPLISDLIDIIEEYEGYKEPKMDLSK